MCVTYTLENFSAVGSRERTFQLCNAFIEKMSVNPEVLRSVARNITKFSWEFFQILTKDNPNENIVCSPLSAAVVLSMVTSGARERTEEQLRAALRLSDDVITQNGLQSLIDALNNFSAVELRLANKIFRANRFNLRTEFEEVLKTVFRSESDIFDPTNAKEASEFINNWCEQKTNNRIKDVVDPDDVKKAILILVNAVYFKGNWAEKFDPELTRTQPFHINESTIKEVPMMYKNDKFNFGHVDELNAKYVELPYKSDDIQDSISMFIILPDEPTGLQHVEVNLDKMDFSKLRRRPQKIAVHLPKFKIEYKFDLEKTLRKMGLNDIFEDTANFSGISESPLKVSKASQKAFIEVNEEGTEAAVVTDVQMMLMCAHMTMPIVVNRPFIFVIVANHTDTQLFNGRIVDPTAN